MAWNDLFGGNKTPAAPVAQQAPQTQQANSQADPNQQQQAPVISANSAEAPTGLAQFNNLFAPIENQQQQPGVNNLFNIDATKIAEQASKLNFTEGVPQEVFQAVANGGEGAVTAMAAIVNHAVQKAFAQSTMLSATLTQQAFQKVEPHMDDRVNRAIRNQQIDNTIRESNPIFQSPAVRPLMDMVKAQLSQQYPNETPNQIASRAGQYFSALASDMTPKQVSQEKIDEQKWGSFLAPA